MDRVAAIEDEKQQTLEEKKLDYRVKVGRTEIKKYEWKIRKLNELTIWMKNSTVRVHLGTLNKFTESYQVL